MASKNKAEPIVWSSRNGRTEANDVQLWGVSWDRSDGGAVKADGTVRRTGNSWTSKALAERVFRDRERDGLNPTANTSWCAGFARGLR